jgi:hypothetical protein
MAPRHRDFIGCWANENDTRQFRMKFLNHRQLFQGAENDGSLKDEPGKFPVSALILRRHCLSLALALVLVLTRVSRALGQESDLGYRHEFYREDGDRMSIDTDSFLLDAKITSHVRVTGTYVIDSISGATPIGAPPQKKWPFASFNDLYNRAYGQAYTSQYNQFVSQNQIYVDAGYETFQQMTNQAAQFAQQAAPGIATNSATASYHSLTNNPNYRKNTVPLAKMHDRRQGFSIGLPVSWGRHELTPLFSHSEETDYKSISGALNYSLSLNEKNTTLNFGYAHNADRARNDKFVWEDKTSDNLLVGCVQLLSPKSYVTFNFVLNNDSGYLSDPYRGVMVRNNYPQYNPDDPALIPEVRPRNRSSAVVYGSYTRFIEPLDGSLDASLRFFHDSWGIFSATTSLDWHQKLGDHFVLTPTFRYTYQTAADFYYVLVPDYLNLPTSYSSDYRLSQMETFTMGLSLTWRVARHVSFDASYYRYMMHGLDGVTSQSAYPSANVGSLGLRIWF